MATRTGLLDGPVSRFQVGDCIGTSFSVWGKNLLPFSLLTLIVHSPLIVYMLVKASQGVDADEEGSRATQSLIRIVDYLLTTITTGAMTYGVVQQMRGTRVGIGSSIGVGLKRVLPCIGVGILAILCIAGGLILLIVPGIIIACGLWVAVPVTVIESPGVTASLKRSWALTRGVKGSVFLVNLLMGLIQVAAAFVLGFAVASAGGADPMALAAVVIVVTVLFGSLAAVTTAVGYFQLRQSREGASLDDLAKVFE